LVGDILFDFSVEELEAGAQLTDIRREHGLLSLLYRWINIRLKSNTRQINERFGTHNSVGMQSTRDLGT
ncbi:MAG TPA: hypothetical protein VGW96_01875, partial [Candidatus Eremiobacteraceae bacterium]|nr:hypothetical protein [Candidatus Eremiobacteraceae bacterium]